MCVYVVISGFEVLFDLTVLFVDVELVAVEVIAMVFDGCVEFVVVVWFDVVVAALELL